MASSPSNVSFPWLWWQLAEHLKASHVGEALGYEPLGEHIGINRYKLL
jgi:hypothetical protein